jgi:hypothetical protein
MSYINTKQRSKGMKFYNTQPEFGEAGPHEAATKEELADEMEELFQIWAQEAWDNDEINRVCIEDNGGECVDEKLWKEKHIEKIRRIYINGLTAIT